VRAWTLFSRLLYGFATAPHDLQNASEQAPSFAGTRLCRHQALQAPGFAGTRLCRHQALQAPGFAGTRLCNPSGYADL